jgi:hypothetical protein
VREKLGSNPGLFNDLLYPKREEKGNITNLFSENLEPEVT